MRGKDFGGLFRRGCRHRPDYLGFGGILWLLFGGSFNENQEEAWMDRRDEYQRIVPFFGNGFTLTVAPFYPRYEEIKEQFKRRVRSYFRTCNRSVSEKDAKDLVKSMSPETAIEYDWLFNVRSYRSVVDLFLGARCELGVVQRCDRDGSVDPSVDPPADEGSPDDSGDNSCWLQHSILHAIWRDTPVARPEIPFLPLSDYQEWIRSSFPLHLSAAQPTSANVVLGRLIREGLIRQVITTNYDCLVELGAHLAGMHILHSSDANNLPSDDSHLFQRSGTHEVLTVVESGDRYGQRYLGRRASYLYKIHGGIESACGLLCDGRFGRVAEQSLRDRGLFLATRSDTLWWRPESWQTNLFEEAFRGARILMIGASGGDVVTFQNVRRLQEYHRTRSRARGDHAHSYSGDPAVVGWAYREIEQHLDVLLSEPPPVRGPGRAPSPGEPFKVPLAHVKDTELAFHALASFFYARGITRALRVIGGNISDMAEELLAYFVDHVLGGFAQGGIEELLCGNTSSSQYRAQRDSLKNRLALFHLALPRWATFSLSLQRSLMPALIGKGGTLRPGGPWYTIPFLNLLEERLSSSRGHRGRLAAGGQGGSLACADEAALMIYYFAIFLYAVLALDECALFGPKSKKTKPAIQHVDPWFGAVTLALPHDDREGILRECGDDSALPEEVRKVARAIVDFLRTSGRGSSRVTLFPVFDRTGFTRLGNAQLTAGFPGFPVFTGVRQIWLLNHEVGSPQDLAERLRCEVRARPRETQTMQISSPGLGSWMPVVFP